VPKPLKFLSPRYEKLKSQCDSETDAAVKAYFSDLVSVIGMVASKNEDVFDALKYCLTGTKKDLVSWGHEYLRCLAGQIGSQY